MAFYVFTYFTFARLNLKYAEALRYMYDARAIYKDYPCMLGTTESMPSISYSARFSLAEQAITRWGKSRNAEATYVNFSLESSLYGVPQAKRFISAGQVGQGYTAPFQTHETVSVVEEVTDTVTLQKETDGELHLDK